jgi:hypothetical protein
MLHQHRHVVCALGAFNPNCTFIFIVTGVFLSVHDGGRNIAGGARAHQQFSAVLAAKCKTDCWLLVYFFRGVLVGVETQTRGGAASATDGCCKRCMCVRPAAQWAGLSMAAENSLSVNGK